MTKAMPDCFICGKTANATGSHLAPAWLIAPCIGERNFEELFQIEVGTGKVETYFGRSNEKNNEHALTTEKKQHLYTLDHIFCSTCEHKLGQLEDELKKHLSCTFEENESKSIFSLEKTSDNIDYKIFQKVNSNAFLVFWYSLMYRVYIRHFVKYGHHIINSGEAKFLKEVVNEFLYTNNIITHKDAARFFHFFVISKKEFINGDKGLITDVEKDGHNNLYLCQFIMEFYTKTDKYDPKNVVYSSLVNRFESTPCAVIISDELWNTNLYELKFYNTKFMKSVASRLSEITKMNANTILEEYKLELESLKASSPVDLNHFALAEDKIIKKYAAKGKID